MTQVSEKIDRRSVEAAVIGSLVLFDSNEAVEYAASELDGSEFQWPEFRVMFRAVCSMTDRGTPVDGVTLADELARRGDLEHAGGAECIAEVMESVPHASHCRYYVKQLQDHHQRDQLKLIGKRLSQLPDDMTVEASAMIDATLMELESIRSGHARHNELMTAADALEAHDKRRNDPSGVIKTGIIDLDSLLRGGLRPGQLVVVGGRPGLGKSALMAQMILNAGKAGNPGLIISLEMTAGEHAERALTTINRERFAALPVYFSEASDFGKLINITRLAKRQHGVVVVAVDYLQLMESTIGKNDMRERQIATMSRGLKRLAMELQVPILLGSQLNRESEKRGRPSLADLRESGAIEQDADIVILIAGDAEGNERELIIAKHRGGSPGLLKMRFEGRTFSFSSEAWTGNL